MSELMEPISDWKCQRTTPLKSVRKKNANPWISIKENQSKKRKD
jgi:endonuclease I